MPTRFLSEINDIQIRKEIARAQVTAVLRGMSTALITNAVMASGACAIAMFNHDNNSAAIYWLIAIFMTLAFRGLLAAALQHFDLPARTPLVTLRLICVGAFFSGITWTMLPFILNDFNATSADSGIYLIMLGMGAGAVLMGSTSSIMPLAFALPIYLGTAFSLMQQGPQGALLGACVMALTYFLYRGSRQSEAAFYGHARSTLRSNALAESLSKANSEIMTTNARLEKLASCDPLTGLSNRTAFNEALAAGISGCKQGEQLALLVVDLDGFKIINDTLGHSVGDNLLVFISNRMRHSINGADVIARLGGDEFAVIYTGADAVERARQQCVAMLERSHAPIIIAEQSCMVGTSIGLSIYPDHAVTAEDLFVCADMALYRAKDLGRQRWCEFHPDFRAAANRRHQIEQDFAAAIDSGAVEAWFQPQLMLDDSGIIGFEALVRWKHPQLGPIAPPEIVHAALTTRMSDKLTAVMTEASCRLLNELPSLGLPHATVAVNISPRELGLYSVVDVIDCIASRHCIDPRLLEIEITEEALLDTGATAEQLSRLGQSGYKLAVDDFGAGHSSLTYLTAIKVDRLKIDRGITCGVTTSEQNRNIVAALVGLGKSLSIEIMVEGVETSEDVAVLQTLGCHAAQGYFFARPMPAADIVDWIAARPSNTRKVDFKPKTRRKV